MKTSTAQYLAAASVALATCSPFTEGQAIALKDLVGAFKNKRPDPSATIFELHRLGKALRARYTASCNHAWATTEAYAARTDRLEEKISKLAREAGFRVCPSIHNLPLGAGPLWLEIQDDPRGAPILLSIGGQEYALGEEE